MLAVVKLTMSTEVLESTAGLETDWVFNTVFLLFLLPFFAITNT